MKIKSNGINLYDTLFSGQCFRMEEESDGSFTLILSDRVINIKDEGDYLVLDSNVLNDLDLVVTKYLDLERDYEFINSRIGEKCGILRDNIHLCEGYRILNQDKFEMFITYIISQNNNVKRIIGSVNKLSKLYGKRVYFRDKEYYLFPTFDEMKDITLEELKSIGVGFRDSYIKSALNKLVEDSLFLDEIDMMSTDKAIKELVSIKGIGIKVASCILLFAYGRLDTFPIDTWVRHFVSDYFSMKDEINVISKFMKETFGEYSGIAIQYFYHIQRNKKRQEV